MDSTASRSPPQLRVLPAGDIDDARQSGGTMTSSSDLVKQFRLHKKEFFARQRKQQAGALAGTKAALEAIVTQRLQSLEAALPKSLPIPARGVMQIEPSASGRQQAPARDQPPRDAEQQQQLPRNVLALALSERSVSVKVSSGGEGGAQAAHQTVKVQVQALPAAQPPPSYTTWAYLKRNELAQDHGRRMFLVDEHGETVPADDGENEERLPWEGVDGVALDWAMTCLAEAHGWDNPNVLQALMEVLRPQAQPEAIAQRLAYLLRLRVPDVERDDTEVEDVMDKFEGSFCRRCRVYGCRTHSGGHVKPHHRPAPPPPEQSAPPCGPDCHRRAMDTDAPTGPGAKDAPAGRGASSSGAAGLQGWSVYSVSLLRRGIQTFGRRNPCMIADLLRPTYTCAEVKAALDDLGQAERKAAGLPVGAGGVGGAVGEPGSHKAGEGAQCVGSGSGGVVAADGHGGVEEEAGGLARVPARRKGGRAKKTVMTNRSTGIVYHARNQRQQQDHLAGNQRQQQDQLFHEYQPCTCVGQCKADCPCVQALNFCEKFCACSTSCRERFRGCNCKSGCRTNQCPCLAASRECDPDSCTSCALTMENRAEPGRECHNMRLRMRQHARVVLGTSDIPGAGWGLFAAQHVSKNGFLGEYTGDLITQDEANRRGSVYDHMNNSYLFNLNEEWVVDAKFRGNKLRCANHSHDPVAKARVLLVDGESRIGIFADRSVAPGMEITFDYRYSDDTAPQWVKKKKRS